MKSEPKEPSSAGRFDDEIDWKGEHERRKRTWSDEDRRQRKERRNPGAMIPDEAGEVSSQHGFPL